MDNWHKKGFYSVCVLLYVSLSTRKHDVEHQMSLIMELNWVFYIVKMCILLRWIVSKHNDSKWNETQVLWTKRHPSSLHLVGRAGSSEWDMQEARSRQGVGSSGRHSDTDQFVGVLDVNLWHTQYIVLTLSLSKKSTNSSYFFGSFFLGILSGVSERLVVMGCYRK